MEMNTYSIGCCRLFSSDNSINFFVAECQIYLVGSQWLVDMVVEISMYSDE